MPGNQPEIYRLFGDLLDYPTEELPRQTRALVSGLALTYPQEADNLQAFGEFTAATPLGRMEEIYTGTFDVNPSCYIYAGYILFGETFKRAKFMVRLKERYREHNFPLGNELPDHLPVLFRFLAVLDPEDRLTAQLVEQCLIPVLGTMVENFPAAGTDQANPYALVLAAARVVLSGGKPAAGPESTGDTSDRPHAHATMGVGEAVVTSFKDGWPSGRSQILASQPSWDEAEYHDQPPFLPVGEATASD